MTNHNESKEYKVTQPNQEDLAKQPEYPAANTQNQVPRVPDTETKPDNDTSGSNATVQKGEGGASDDTTTTGGDTGTRARQDNGRNGTKNVDTAFDSDNKDIDQDASETVQEEAEGNDGKGGNNG